MSFSGKVRDRVRKFFNPEAFDSTAFRDTVASGMMGMMLGELVVYIFLKQSAELGELPNYIPDALIIGISVIEFLLGPVLGWLGSEKRRSKMICWVWLGLVCTVSLFALPSPETIPDAGLCTGVTPTPRYFPVGITWKAAVRLSLLLICAVAYAFGRVAMMSHGLAYLNEYNPSDNLLMHVGIFILHRILLLLVGSTVIKGLMLNMPWLQILLLFLQFVVALLRLHRYPVLPPTVEKLSGNDRSLIRSLARVLSSKMAMLQMFAMSLVAAAFWGFSSQEADFIKVKYRMVSTNEGIMGPLVYLPVLLSIILVGYMYTTPVMAKFDRKAAVRNSMMMCLRATLLYVVLTWWLGCSRGEIAGLGEQTYIQPTCAQSCGCDRPWIQFTPVCAPEQLTTYFSPCHAGCASPDTFNGLGVFSNCTCTPTGRVTLGACDDGTCAHAYTFHQLLVVLLTTLSSLAMIWQGTMIIESVDRRDVSVALGLASGMVALFAFVGAHGFYLGISTFTCAFRQEPKCLFHNEQFVPWVGYSSATLVGLALLVSVVAFFIVRREKTEEEPKDATEDLNALILGISAIESLLGPLLGWLGSEKRRSMMKGWVLLSLVCTLPLFALPSPETIPDAGLCSGITPTVRYVLVGITSKAAVRLSLLVICAVACAFGRVVMMSHGLAYLNEYNPSDNLLMHVGIFFLHRIGQLLIGNIVIKSWTLSMPWLLALLVFIKFAVTLVLLQRYPVVPPTVQKLNGNDRSFIHSLARVLSSKVAMLQMLAMSLVAAALWGFSSQEAEFVKVKYRIVPTIEGLMGPLMFFIQVLLAILLVGYMYTTPVMAKFDRKAAVRNSMMMCLRSTLLYIALTWWLGCNQEEIAGLAKQTYVQPVCAQSCGCDRPWIQFTPVCAPEQLTTYFSPCHAGCASSDTFNGLDVYSNCTCAPLGRVTIGACDDGSCAHEHLFHQLLYVLLVTLSSLAMIWQGTMIIESVDRRDVSVALGLASGMVALFAFVGAHGFYLGISTFTCAFRQEPKCLFHNEQFVPWVGYSSATLAGLALLVSVVTFIIVWREKKTEGAQTDATEDFS